MEKRPLGEFARLAVGYLKILAVGVLA